MKIENATGRSVSGEQERDGRSRRQWLTSALTVGTAVLAASRTGDAAEEPSPEVADRPEALVDGNVMERTSVELDRAMQKPVAQRDWVMVIDQQKCIGCKACTVSCAAENNLPPGVVYRPVLEEEVGEFPNVRRRFIPRPCLQCDNPPCTPVCPVSATYKREDGIIAIDYDVCIGCRYCLVACPYNARTSDYGEFYGEQSGENPAAFVGQDALAYETRPNFEYGTEWQRAPGGEASPVGNARKCHFCLHRIENGLLPACVTTCLGGATYFGDYQDPTSLVHELIGSTRAMRLKEELGTEPKVYYLV